MDDDDDDDHKDDQGVFNDDDDAHKDDQEVFNDELGRRGGACRWVGCAACSVHQEAGATQLVPA